MNEDHLTLQTEASAEFTEKRSRFIGYAAPVSTEEEAVSFLREIRARHRDARHNVYAYIVNTEGTVNQRYSDDGEPQGTGGMPVLDVIRKRGLMNCCVVVTRYFGGILLGAPGLVRAYSRAAAAALDAAGVREVIKCRTVGFVIPYPLYRKIAQYAETEAFTLLSSEFGESVRLAYAVPEGKAEEMRRTLTDLTNGKILFEETDP